jgi:tetratricopeptide (TPR) repeat protein
MKPILAVVFLLLLASNLEAQSRHRAVSAAGTLDRGVTSLGSFDSIPVVWSHPELDRAPALTRSNPVPVSQLRIPSKAIKEFERAQKAFRSGDMRVSSEHLQKALQIYPNFVQAHNALGLRFAQLGEYRKALAEHESALSLDPLSAETHQDLSFALLLLNRSQEAEDEARQALALDSHSAAARYVLGRALVAQRHVTPEAIDMLRQSESAFPNASLVLAQIHFTLGQTDQVVTELRQYLRTAPDPQNKQKAECWVAQLSQQPLPAACPADITRPSFH